MHRDYLLDDAGNARLHVASVMLRACACAIVTVEKQRRLYDATAPVIFCSRRLDHEVVIVHLVALAGNILFNDPGQALLVLSLEVHNLALSLCIGPFHKLVDGLEATAHAK